jgi:hypothetical protein
MTEREGSSTPGPRTKLSTLHGESQPGMLIRLRSHEKKIREIRVIYWVTVYAYEGGVVAKAIDIGILHRF